MSNGGLIGICGTWRYARSYWGIHVSWKRNGLQLIKAKINTRSSTECELVSVFDNMPTILWTIYFLEEQGYPVKPVTIHQDNMSTMLLENTGRGSSSKRMQHINIRYFFVTDQVKKNHVRVAYCPTDDMIADFFTKPLSGSSSNFGALS
mmetsp:Transcript_5988/g.9150  ORF Transcript_5988/g.9150 Transcript_5988/m.9150 type:complete len:149 (-) Transcript_5988:648-1094(-)